MLFDKGRVIDAVDIEASDLESAVTRALERYDRIPEWTKFELWCNGKIVRIHWRALRSSQ
jgi:hypothetical protein